MERKPYEHRTSLPQCSYRNVFNIQDFTVLDYLRTRYYRKDGTPFMQMVLYLCGASAGLTSLTITTPLEFVRVRLAMERDTFSYHNNTNAFKIII